MAIKRVLLVVGVVASIGMTSLSVIGTVAADTSNSRLARNITSRFNLNKGEVQNVLDEQEAERQQKLDEILSQAVTDGKISQEQKDTRKDEARAREE